jgi:ribosomal-protein-alanine N-acetyltransferase
MIIAQTERLVVRHLHMLDHEPMLRVFGDSEVMRFGDGVQPSEWVRRWIAACLQQRYPQWGFGPYAVVERSRREVIGYCGLFFFADIGGRSEVELGYRLARSWWGNGYATEAALAVRDYALHMLCLKRLIALIDPANTASIRVATKLGMRYEREVILEGYSHPDHVYAMTAAPAR